VTKTKSQREIEREIKKVATDLLMDGTTKTKEGIKQYRQIERGVEKLAQNSHAISEWEKVKKRIVEFLNREIP